jgi:hypothetical protein
MNCLNSKFEKFVSKDHSAGVQEPVGAAGVNQLYGSCDRRRGSNGKQNMTLDACCRVCRTEILTICNAILSIHLLFALCFCIFVLVMSSREV